MPLNSRELLQVCVALSACRQREREREISDRPPNRSPHPSFSLRPTFHGRRVRDFSTKTRYLPSPTPSPSESRTLSPADRSASFFFFFFLYRERKIERAPLTVNSADTVLPASCPSSSSSDTWSSIMAAVVYRYNGLKCTRGKGKQSLAPLERLNAGLCPYTLQRRKSHYLATLIYSVIIEFYWPVAGTVPGTRRGTATAGIP